MNTTKKCPMCAEQIPADAAFCPYCGTRFGEKAQAAPPPAAPAVVVVTNAAPVNIQPAPPASTPAKKSHVGLWIGGAFLLVILCGVIGVLLWTQRTNIPAISSLLATPTPTFTPTLPPTLTPTITPTSTPTPTATVTPVPAWINDFAKPILAAIENRRPDLQNDYSTDSKVFACEDQILTCKTEGGVLKLRDQWNIVMSVGVYPNDFVWAIEFTPRIVNRTSGVGISFWSGYWLSFDLENGSIFFRDVKIGDYKSDIGMNITTRVVVIAKGDRMAVYLNDRPIAYEQGLENDKGSIRFNLSQSDGTTEVHFDNVKFWRLNNIPNLP